MEIDDTSILALIGYALTGKPLSFTNAAAKRYGEESPMLRALAEAELYGEKPEPDPDRVGVDDFRETPSQDLKYLHLESYSSDSQEPEMQKRAYSKPGGWKAHDAGKVAKTRLQGSDYLSKLH